MIASRQPRQRKGAAQRSALLSSPMPIYVQLIMHFRQQIETGQWAVGQKIPTLEELAREFGVTRLTIRQAIEFLKQEGLVSSRQGFGTVIIAQPKKILWRDLPRSWAELVDSADTLESDMLELARPMRLPKSPDRRNGELAPNYHVIRRLLRREGLPYIVGTSYIDQRIVDAVGLKALKTRSIYRFLEMSQISRPARGDQTLQLGTADAEVAYLLDVPLGSCVAIVMRWVYDQNDTLIYHSEGQFRGHFVQTSRRLC
jgi:GntR family transcriptional regulator